MSEQEAHCEERITELQDQNKKLREIISKIEDRAYIWDGKDSIHYGNIIMKIIHPDWGVNNA